MLYPSDHYAASARLFARATSNCQPITAKATLGLHELVEACQQQRSLLTALQLVGCSFRQLHIRELHCALRTLDDGTEACALPGPLPCWNPNSKTANDLASICTNLLVISEDQYVDFASENLESLVRSRQFQAFCYTKGYGPHEIIAIACVRQLTMCSLQGRSTSRSKIPEGLDVENEPCSFSSYALESWSGHCRRALPESRYLIAAINISFRTMIHSDAVGFIHDDDRSTEDEETRCLRLCAAYGLKLPAKTFIEMGARINKQHGDTRKSVLHLSVARGNIDVARLLLCEGAKVSGTTTNGICSSCGCRTYESMLHAEVRAANRAGVQFLLESGADALELDAHDITPLRLAVMKGNKDVVQWLLDHLPTDQNVVRHFHDCSVLASDLRNLEIARLLLDRCAALVGWSPAEKTPANESSPKQVLTESVGLERAYEDLLDTMQSLDLEADVTASEDGVRSDNASWTFVNEDESV